MQTNHEVNIKSAMERSIVNSALWAAAGDALGWITELSHGESGVKRRIGTTKVSKTVPWERIIGGKGGAKAKLPAGTYSDDTQLRLAVSRSIRENGFFDVESFAKIELTVWLSYSLGGGLGTKAAARNLTKRSVSWFTNFFENNKQNYFYSGGNGAAMRIQPHVWCSFNKEYRENLYLNIIKDSLVTHGHPHGFCGAIFHAMVLSDTIKNKKIPSPDAWISYAMQLSSIPDLVRDDSQLNTFWLTSWEQKNNCSLIDAIKNVESELIADIKKIDELVKITGNECYHEILSRLGCLTSKFRGSGLKTALASTALSYMFKDIGVEDALICAANELDSDTDTIATMCGAILGAIADHTPDWDIQDQDYIQDETLRLLNIDAQKNNSSFNYPDVGNWNPPVNQVDTIGYYNNELAITGLGYITPINNEEFHSNDAIWQWYSLPFGQTILAKRRKKITQHLTIEQFPREIKQPHIPHRVIESQMMEKKNNTSSQYPLEFNKSNNYNELVRHEQKTEKDPLDQATDDVINSNFDDLTLGRLLNACIDSTQSVQLAVSFTAIIAKAKIVRQRRKN
ncbi:TPA: ADP-ribosylglycohydrolase family protein [Escherichia coli]|nr:ADP-ribosylglycohydrolase family protein [Escherichia coli]